jgi:hypothetical protein
VGLGLRGIPVAALTMEGRWPDDAKVAGLTWVGRWSDDRVAGMTIQRVAALTIDGRFE